MSSSRGLSSSNWSPYSGGSYLRYSKYSSRKAKRNDFLFMAEFGMTLKSKKYEHKKAKNLMKELNHRLHKDKFATKVEKAGSPSDWTLLHDKSIGVEANNKNTFGVAIISPVYDFKDFKAWIRDFRDLFRTLHKYFDIGGWWDCGTHIYLIPARGGWHVEQIKRLAVSAVYYEPVFNSLVGDTRKRPTWAKSNRYNGYFGHKRFKTTKHVVAKLRKQGKITDVGKRMCWVGKKTATGDALHHSKSKTFPHWSFEWNMTWVKNSGLGIVEFQQLPMSEDVSYGVGWTLLTLLFVRTAMSNGKKFKLKKDGPGVDDLKKIIGSESKKTKVPKKGRELLKHIFDHPHTVASASEYAKVLNPAKITKDEGHQLVWRGKHGQTALKKYIRWVKETQSKSRLSKISKLNSSYFSKSKSSSGKSSSKSKSGSGSGSGSDSDSDSSSVFSSSYSKSKSKKSKSKKSKKTSYWDSSLSDTKSSYSTTKSDDDDDDTITLRSFKSWKSVSTSKSGKTYSSRKSYRSLTRPTSSRSRSRSKSKSRKSSKKSKKKGKKLDTGYIARHQVPAALVLDKYGKDGDGKKKKEKSSSSTISGDSDMSSLSKSRTSSWVLSGSSTGSSS